MSARMAARRIAAVCGLMLVAAPAGAATDSINVTVDRASVIRSPEGTATVIVGNPLIADATSQRNGVLVITGKSFGTTNIMLLDGAGTLLSETLVHVGRASDGTIVVQRGGKRESLACTPRCEPVLAVGDDPDNFSTTAKQIGQRSGLSVGEKAD
ncbi:pilus assembly protein N-terminal domain-containing protein [Methylopila sp. 73B]|uniref:pilus assembly protein N-terminal domain-containing protein n=1 Tax=Methylopila sp. 73B TaxID=1120792 RepID=UPI000363B0C9|nr:pilus assembly protein N-terminal domain-containing protein [Methylopila sp. 73B]